MSEETFGEFFERALATSREGRQVRASKLNAGALVGATALGLLSWLCPNAGWTIVFAAGALITVGVAAGVSWGASL